MNNPTYETRDEAAQDEIVALLRSEGLREEAFYLSTVANEVLEGNDDDGYRLAEISRSDFWQVLRDNQRLVDDRNYEDRDEAIREGIVPLIEGDDGSADDYDLVELSYEVLSGDDDGFWIDVDLKQFWDAANRCLRREMTLRES